MEAILGSANDGLARGHEGGHEFPRLLADIGGTNVRFALEFENGDIGALSIMPIKAYSSLSAAVNAYMSHLQTIAAGVAKVRHAAFAIANSVDGDWLKMTNAAWEFSIEAMRLEFRFETLLIVNDFSALAMAIPRLANRQKLQIGGGLVVPGKPIGLLGAGTGLGVSGLVPADNEWIALETEGGHVDFSPANEREISILRYAWQEYPHVSIERLLSGMGLELIFRALATQAGVTPESINAPEISRRALAAECPLCDEAIEFFCTMLGTVAGNLALTLGAKGGIYIGGGIVPSLGDRFVRSGFRARFEEKGRFSHYLAAIPTYVITADTPTLLGVSAILARYMGARSRQFRC